MIACLGYSRAGGGGAHLLQGRPGPPVGRGSLPVGAWAACPSTLVWDREGALHAGEGRPTGGLRRASAGGCGVGLALLRSGRTPRPRGRSSACRATPRRTSSRAGASPTSTTSHDQLDALVREGEPAHPPRACAVARSIAWPRSAAPWRPLPAGAARRRSADRHCACRAIRTCAWTPTTTRSIPRLVGRRVEVRVGQGEITAVALDTGEPAARHRRSFARHRTIDDLAHARASSGRAAARRSSLRSSERSLQPLRRAHPGMSQSRPSSPICFARSRPRPPRARWASWLERARAEEWSYERFAEALSRHRGARASPRAASCGSAPRASRHARPSRSSTSPSPAA